MIRAAPRAGRAATRSSIARLMAVAVGYSGVVTFVLVFYLTLETTRSAPGDLVLDRATSAPLWIWLVSITAAITVAGAADLLRRESIHHGQPSR